MTLATQASGWLKRNPPPPLARSDIHLWKARVSDLKARRPLLSDTLSLDEHQRAQRYRFEKDRDQFRLTRGLLRHLVGRYLHHPPAALSFAYSDFGKPSLTQESSSPPLQFNVSHSRDLALIALSSRFEMGIDVEFMRPDVAFCDLAKSCFSEREQASLNAEEPDRRKERFYRGWTRKEAVIKGQGEGLSLPLDSFTVSTDPTDHKASLSLTAASPSIARIALYHLDIGEPDYAAALATARRPQSIKCFQLA